jgi:hypothetical protein
LRACLEACSIACLRACLREPRLRAPLERAALREE